MANPRQENCRARLYVSPKIFCYTNDNFIHFACSQWPLLANACPYADRVIFGLDLVSFSFLEHFWWNLRLLQVYKATVLEKDVSSMYNMAIG